MGSRMTDREFKPAAVEAPVHALAGVIRRADGAERLERDPEAFLDELGLEGPDRDAMLALGPKRLMAYRSLVHNRARGVIERFLPRCHALVGGPDFGREVDLFLDQCGISSPYLRDVPREFVDWAEVRWRDDEAFGSDLAELARYELAAQDIANDARPTPADSGVPVALDRPVRFNPNARVLRFSFDPLDGNASWPPSVAPTCLLVCRDRKDVYRELVVSELGAALFEALAEGQALGAAVQAAAAAVTRAVDDPLLEEATYALGAMMEIDALLGAEIRGEGEAES